jgi:uroporphyrinogen decarboxylase
MNSRERLLAACRGEPVDRPPVWLMRQAGRYLPEYQELRGKYSFWELMRTPSLAMDVTLQPLRRFNMDAAILFSDILVVHDAMGAEVSYGNGGPVIRPKIRTRDDLERLEKANHPAQFDYIVKAVEGLCDRLHPEVGVIGFAGAPFTLAAYFIEEGPAKNLDRLKQIAADQPELYWALLTRISDVVVELLAAQIRAGADMVQLFDTWAGKLSLQDYRDLALPYVRRVVKQIRDMDVPVALYVRNTADKLEAAASSGCSVLAIDDSLALSEARSRLNPRTVLQGNFNPAGLEEPAERIRSNVHAMIADAGSQGYIVNLGQGLVPGTPVEGVGAFVNAVREWSS